MEEEEEKINEWYDLEKEKLESEFETILKAGNNGNTEENKYNQKMKDLHAKYEQNMVKLFEKEKTMIKKERKRKNRTDLLSRLTKFIKEKLKKQEEQE